MFGNDLWIKKYPFLGSSQNLMEYFTIIGYEQNYLIDTVIPFFQNNPNTQTSPYKPTIITSITSNNDYGFVDNSLIINQVFPDNPKLLPYSNWWQPKKSDIIYSFCFDTQNGDSKLFYICYAYLFYEVYNNQFFVPKALCIISQYPFFTTFHKICVKLYDLFICSSRLNEENIKQQWNNSMGKTVNNYSFMNYLTNTGSNSSFQNGNNNNNNNNDVSASDIKAIMNDRYFRINKSYIPIEYIIYNMANFIPSPINFQINWDLFAFIDQKRGNVASQDNKEEMDESIEIKHLSGYPYVDFNLSELFNFLPLSLVVEIFLWTIIEPYMLFFSYNLEMLNIIMYIMSILNYPCNDSTYLWHIVSVPKSVLWHPSDNKFVNKIMTSLLGINCSYDDSLDTFKYSKSHFIVDIDNKRIILRKAPDLPPIEVGEFNNLQIFMEYIEAILKDKKMPSKILNILITNLTRDLEGCLREGNMYYSIYPKNKTVNFYEFNNDIYMKNRKIQEIFYNFYLSILTIFYQDNTWNSSFDKIKKDESIDEEDNQKKFYFLDYHANSKFSKEEKIFFEEFRSTIKYKIYMDNFIKDGNSWEVYKIPWMFSEEFINIKKNDKNNKVSSTISYFDIIDNYYFANTKNQSINITMNNFYSIYQDKASHILPGRVPNFSNNWNLISLNKNWINNYIYEIRNYSDTEWNDIFPSLMIRVEDSIQLIDRQGIPDIIEKEMWKMNWISNNEIIFYSIIYMFCMVCSKWSFTSTMYILSTINSTWEKNSFFTRKYINILLRTFFRFLMINKETGEYPTMSVNSIKMYYFVLVNFMRSNQMLPNEEMMKLLRLFNKEVDIYLDSVDSDNGNNIANGFEDNFDSVENDSTAFKLYMQYCFEHKGIIKPEQMVERAWKEFRDCDIVLDNKSKSIPKIVINIFDKEISSDFYSPRKVYRIIREIYDTYTKDGAMKIVDVNVNKQLISIMVNLILYATYIKSNYPYSFIINGLYYCLKNS